MNAGCFNGFSLNWNELLLAFIYSRFPPDVRARALSNKLHGEAYPVNGNVHVCLAHRKVKCKMFLGENHLFDCQCLFDSNSDNSCLCVCVVCTI